MGRGKQKLVANLTPETVARLYDEGWTNKKIAEHYSMSPGRVSQLYKQAQDEAAGALAKTGTKNVIAAQMIGQGKTLNKQFAKVNASVFDIFTLLSDAINGEKSAKKKLKDLDISGKDTIRSYFNAATALLSQQKQALEIAERLFQHETNYKFREAVMAILDDLDEDTRRRFVKKVKNYVELERTLNKGPGD